MGATVFQAVISGGYVTSRSLNYTRRTQNRARAFRIALVALLALGSVAVMASCAQSSKYTGRIAATVQKASSEQSEPTEIAEDIVTNYIQNYRSENSLDNEDTWGSFLAVYQYTPESFRSAVIDYYVHLEAGRMAAEEYGVTVSDEVVDAQVESVKSQYQSQESWETALGAAGYTENTFREAVQFDLMNALLRSKVVSQEPMDEATLVQFCNKYATTYAGMKRSSHILFASTDKATAEKVLEQIQSGELSFDEAARTYSKDASASNGGDVGWNMLNDFVSQYEDALDALDKGEVSGLVTSTYGIHIIKCTDVFDPPSPITESSQVPAELLDVVQSYAASESQSSAYNEWLDAYVDELDVQKFDMPEDVPYNVDMERYPG